jgi:hypothetical protein
MLDNFYNLFFNKERFNKYTKKTVTVLIFTIGGTFGTEYIDEALNDLENFVLWYIENKEDKYISLNSYQPMYSKQFLIKFILEHDDNCRKTIFY